MRDEDEEKCPWCSVFLRDDGSCPNSAHPSKCPFCGAELNDRPPLACPKTLCVSNAVRPTGVHSSFPPPITSSVAVSPRTLRQDLHLYEVLLRARFPEVGSANSASDEDDDPTNPAIPVIHPSLHRGICRGESPPSTKREGCRSGIYPSTCIPEDTDSSKVGS
jgi:hypothetical protein